MSKTIMNKEEFRILPIGEEFVFGNSILKVDKRCRTWGCMSCALWGQNCQELKKKGFIPECDYTQERETTVVFAKVKEETVAEIMEEMKNKAKPFVLEGENYYVFVDFLMKKVRVHKRTYDNLIGMFCFDKETAKNFAERLEAAYDREGWK